MLYDALCQQARAITSSSLAQPLSPERWEATVAERRERWLQMLGLSPLPERTPMEVTVTGTLDRGDYVVEKLHFQSVPGAYVPGNLYRPAHITKPLPAVLYLCGHTKGKVAPTYQAHPRYFAQHGYVALVLDTIEQGESQSDHHGTYTHGRWDWYSRGYTPAGAEVWNGMRAFDYLQSRDDVDGARMGVTGLSGGGAISWFLGAADERARVVVPVCQTGSIEHIATDRATDGHCDCAFWINLYRWCTADIGALIAPRALLCAAGTEDVLWRPHGFRQALHRIHHQYAALGIADQVRLVEDLTPHGYTPKLNRAIFQWFNHHLKGDDTPVTDNVTDYVEPEENLLVFGGKLPEDDAMKRIDTLLVREAPRPEVVDEGQWGDVQAERLSRLCATTFRYMPDLPAPQVLEMRDDGFAGRRCGTIVVRTDDDTVIRLRLSLPAQNEPLDHLVVFALPEDARTGFAGASGSRPGLPANVGTVGVEVRNTGVSSVGPGYAWTMRRVYPLLGYTLPERQTYDLVQAMAVLREQFPGVPVSLYGAGRTAVLAIYAALMDELVAEVILADPPETHREPETPEFLDILPTGDLPENLALLYPRPITFLGAMPGAYEWTAEVYGKLGRGKTLRSVDSAAEWAPQ
ncbi:MAG: acetylxylan esterase [Armatimonadetes bacterium]|nr:acetylxylan esterase [Armatimonadota bacterium]